MRAVIFVGFYDGFTIYLKESQRDRLAVSVSSNDLPRLVGGPVEESPHAGERHRETVKRVNSSRSRTGKLERWR